MKKIAILMIISLGFLNPFEVKSQSKEQTIAWLQSKTGLLNADFIKWYNLRQKGNSTYLTYAQGLYNNTAEHVPTAVKVDFTTITGISFRVEESSCVITLSGSFYGFSSGYGFQLSNDDNSLYEDQWVKNQSLMIITYNTTDTDLMKRIVKAYEHLATLCGANLVKDDLFKN